MRKCASCGRELGAAFATSPVCPCCDGLIAGGTRKRKGPPPPPEVQPSLIDTFERIVARAAEAALAAPATPAVGAQEGALGATAYVGPGGVMPVAAHPVEITGTLMVSSKDFESLGGSLVAQPAAATSPEAASPDVVSPPSASPPEVVAATAPPAPAAAPPPPEVDHYKTTDRSLGATDAKRESPTQLLNTQTFSAPLQLPEDEIALPSSLIGSGPKLDPADVARMSDLWSGTVTGSAHKRKTLQAADEVEEIPSLMVGRRVLQAISGGRAADADYQLLDMIGEGGIGVVYAARQASIDRTVAVKMLKSDKTTDQHQRAKFLSEAVITGELDHPNIVPIYDLGSSQQGSYFYSMKRVVGTPWNKVLAKKSLAENIEILMKVADAVAFAHSRSVVHRDLKPENVMLGNYGEVLLMDWGLALLTAESRKISVAAYDPGMGGTPAYMAPEMATGPIAHIDARSDVYLLGAILFEIVVGRPPHTGPNVMGCLFAAARNEIVPTDHDGELIKIARRSMASSREERPATVKDFQNEIREYQSHAESIVLAVRAQEDLTRASESKDYQDFARALFGFQQALGLWSGSEQAQAGVRATKEAYAEAAVTKADFDLALSLLDAGDLRDDDIRIRATAGRDEREQRQQRLTAAKRMAIGLAALVIVVVTGAFFQINRDRKLALIAEQTAKADRQLAVDAEALAQTAADTATTEAGKARTAETLATQRLNDATLAEQRAREAAALAKTAEAAAIKAAADAKAAQTAKTYEAYVARIGLAAAKIEENSFGTAEALLDQCEASLRRWEWGRLMYLCGQNKQTFRTVGPIDCVAFSPDGKRFAAGSWDNSVRIWSVEGSAPPTVIRYGSKYVHAVAFSPNGKDIAIGGSDPDAYVQIRDAATGELKRTFSGHEDGVLGVAFSRDGLRLLTCSYDKTARLWEIETKKQLHIFQGHNWWVWSAAFAPPLGPDVPETRIVTAGQDGNAFVWDIETEKPSEPFRGHEGPVYAAAFSPDGKYVATAGDDKRVMLWDPADIRAFDFEKLIDKKPQIPVKFDALQGHDAAVRSVGFSADGLRIVSAGNDNTVKVWDAKNRRLEKTLRGHAGWIRSCVLSADGKRLLSGSHDRSAILWDFDKYAEEKVLGKLVLHKHSDAVLHAEFSPDDQRIVTGGRDHTARVWNVADGSSMQISEGHSFLVSQAAFIPNLPGMDDEHPQGRVVTAGIDNTARIWDVARGVEILRLKPAGRAGALSASRDGSVVLTGNEQDGATLWYAETGENLFRLANRGDEIVWTAFSADDLQLFTGDSGGRCCLWSRADGSLLRELSSHTDRITGAVFSDDGKLLLTSSADNSVEQWDLVTGRPLRDRILKHPQAVSSLAATADGRTAVTGCNDGKVRVWDVQSARVLHELRTEKSPQLVALSHDERRIVSTDAVRRTVRMFDLKTGDEIPSPAAGNERLAQAAPFLDLEARDFLVWCAMFSEDDKSLLTVGGDGARLWDAATAAELKSFSPQGAVASVGFSPDKDGARVVTGSWDQSAKIWDSVTGLAIRRLAAAGTGNVNSVRFSSDGKQVLTASEDGQARLWNAETGELEGKSFAQVGAMYVAEFAADGKRIITGGEEITAHRWVVADGRQLPPLEGHTMAVRAVAVSKDGRFIATGSEDTTAIVWNAETGENLYVLRGHTAGVTSVAFTVDGERVLTGSQDNLAKLWDTTTGKEILTLKEHKQAVSSTTFSHDGLNALTTGRDGRAIIWPAVDWGGGKNDKSPLAPDAKTPQTSGRP